MDRVPTRLATLARQLLRYLAQPRRVWPEGSRNAKRALTYRRRVVGQYVRQIRSLQLRGTERAAHLWPLSEADGRLVEELATTTDKLRQGRLLRLALSTPQEDMRWTSHGQNEPSTC
jgi:hypothetical protein